MKTKVLLVIFLFLVLVLKVVTVNALVEDDKFYADVEAGLIPARIAVIYLSQIRLRGSDGEMHMGPMAGALIYGCEEALLDIQRKYSFSGKVRTATDSVAQLSGATHVLVAPITMLPAAGPAWERYYFPDKTLVLGTGAHPVDCSNTITTGAPEKAPDEDKFDDAFWNELTDVLNSPNKDSLLGIVPVPEAGEEDWEKSPVLAIGAVLILLLVFFVVAIRLRNPVHQFN